jgi:hypothetical protein
MTHFQGSALAHLPLRDVRAGDTHQGTTPSNWSVMILRHLGLDGLRFRV